MTMATRKAFLEMLGELAAVFARLEFIVDGSLALLIDREEIMRGLLVTSELNMRRKAELIGRLARLPCHSVERRQRLRSFANRVLKELPLRNRLIHGFWTLREEEMSQGFVTVVDLTPKASSEQNEWNVTRGEQYDLGQLCGRLDCVLDLTDEGVEIIKELNPAMWAGVDAGPDIGAASRM